MIEIPIRIESEANRREHFMAKATRVRRQRETAFWQLKAARPERPALPCTVRLTRVGIRTMDSDNLANGFKACRDGIADWLGVDDGDPRINWEYRQTPKANRYSVLVEFL